MKRQNKVLAITIFTITLIFIAETYLLFTRYSIPTTYPVSSPSMSPKLLSLGNGWVEYSSSALNFKINYPQGFYIQENTTPEFSDNSTLISAERTQDCKTTKCIDLSISINKTEGKYQNTKFAELTEVGGISAKKTASTFNKNNEEFYTIKVPVKDTNYFLEVGFYKTQKEIVEKILESFKIL